MDNSQLNESWTTWEGNPVYWLAPDFWNPKTGMVKLLLPGESALGLSVQARQQRTVEFLKLQGDPRYCDRETSRRMKLLMIERLGTDTPWRGVPPADLAATPNEALNDPPPAASASGGHGGNPFA